MILMLENNYNSMPSQENIRYVWMYEPRFPNRWDANSIEYALRYSRPDDAEIYVASVDNYVLSLR